VVGVRQGCKWWVDAYARVSPPHPEEHAEGVRLEGWVAAVASWFETRGFAALLTMRI
jgi:hypothetical protein